MRENASLPRCIDHNHSPHMAQAKNRAFPKKSQKSGLSHVETARLKPQAKPRASSAELSPARNTKPQPDPPHPIRAFGQTLAPLT